MELQNIHKKERIEGIPVQNLPLFTFSLMSKKSSVYLQISWVNSFEIGNATNCNRPPLSLVTISVKLHVAIDVQEN